ncbi:MAG: class I SAM-dependent methyltransferase [Bacteroidetes bacterium]|nr:MAG: class I SAM-dependent methyltransferase [Bacteroidota bacterium]
MYDLLKKTAGLVISKKWLVKNEGWIRKLLSVQYIGHQFECNICETQLSKFLIRHNSEKMCPACGSLSRNRRLWSLLHPLMQPGKKLLHFSPSRSLFRKLNTLDIHYTSTDFEDEFIAHKQYDITAIDEPDDSFDYIICYHILEHIENDRLAMQELLRVLKPGGTGFIQTPYKDGETYENPKITTPEDRKKHFGQEDHVRIYSFEGLHERLTQSGFRTEMLSFTEEDDHYNGFRSEQLIIIQKP